MCVMIEFEKQDIQRTISFIVKTFDQVHRLSFFLLNEYRDNVNIQSRIIIFST